MGWLVNRSMPVWSVVRLLVGLGRMSRRTPDVLPHSTVLTNRQWYPPPVVSDLVLHLVEVRVEVVPELLVDFNWVEGLVERKGRLFAEEVVIARTSSWNDVCGTVGTEEHRERHFLGILQFEQDALLLSFHEYQNCLVL